MLRHTKHLADRCYPMSQNRHTKPPRDVLEAQMGASVFSPPTICFPSEIIITAYFPAFTPVAVSQF
jgi:hypothetical protein